MQRKFAWYALSTEQQSQSSAPWCPWVVWDERLRKANGLQRPETTLIDDFDSLVDRPFEIKPGALGLDGSDLEGASVGVERGQVDRRVENGGSS
ncbi:unnamed protein product [Rhizoctonia solani]|uniref:Uncharacterized protein n=1 Tax=Rhizoctonia solani TaxID=456999 RepID=A0A8H3A4M2_9AGAM|nr:unnamed protein product [Rhizoctonia solani]